MRRLLSTVLMIVVAGAILLFLQSTTPPYAMLTGPIRTEGAQGDTIASRTFSARVDKAVQAKTIAYKRFGKDVERETSGVWLLVAVEMRVGQQTMPIRAATIRGASGRLYRQSRRADGAPQLLSTKTVQPGLPTTGLLVFEMPEAEVSDMTLLLSSQYGPQLQDEIAIVLDPKKIAVRDKAVIGNDGF
jgi:hypothetical protein